MHVYGNRCQSRTETQKINSMNWPTLILLTMVSLNKLVAAQDPDCTQDGNHPDPDNCGNYYECKDGVASLLPCPFGLFLQ